MIEKGVVNRYAKALAEIISREKDPEKVFDRIFVIVDALLHETSYRFFLNPSISKQDKFDRLSSFLEEIKLEDKYASFLLKVVKNNRFRVLQYLKKPTKEYLYRKLGIVEVDLTVPKKLTTETEKKFVKAFEKKSGKKVKLKVKVDKDIIGGAIARMGSLVIDGSIKTNILKIKEKLTGEL